MVRVPDELAVALREQAASEERTVSEVVRRALRQHLFAGTATTPARTDSDHDPGVERAMQAWQRDRAAGTLERREVAPRFK